MKNTGKAYNWTFIHKAMQSVNLVYYMKIKTFQKHDTLYELKKHVWILQTCSFHISDILGSFALFCVIPGCLIQQNKTQNQSNPIKLLAL